MKVLEGENKRLITDHDQARIRNYELAYWITFAHHAPKKMPEFRATNTPAKQISNEADQERVRGWFISMAHRSGGG